MKIFLRLIGLMIKEPSLILISASLGFLTIGSSVGLLAVSAFLISNAALQVPLADLMVSIVGVRFFGISRAGFRYAERYFTHSTNFKILRNIRVWFYNKLEPLIPGQVNHIHSGDLFSRMVNDIESLKEFYLRVINPPVIAGLVLVLMSFFLSFFHSLLVVSFAFFFLIGGFLIPLLAGRWGRKWTTKTSLIKSNLNMILVDSFSGISEILHYQLQDKFCKRLDQCSEELKKTQRKEAVVSGISSMWISISGSLAMWVALLICIPLIGSGKLRGDLLAVIALAILSSFEAIQPMNQLFNKWEETKGAARRIFEITDMDLKKTLPEEIAGPEGHEIRIEKLWVRYSPDKDWVIRDFSLQLSEGKKVAIVGANGSGKSTLLNVLSGFQGYEKGRILLGNAEISQLASEKLLEQYQIVPQNPFIFNTTLRENLKLANQEATEELMNIALQDVLLYDFISTLPQGLDTYVGEGGFKLSGGQRQRLAIAQGLLKNSPVFILDEPSTGLDLTTEKLLLKSLKAHWKNKSVLLITHRNFALEEMDEILVLHQGKIVERGTYESLTTLKER